MKRLCTRRAAAGVVAALVVLGVAVGYTVSHYRHNESHLDLLTWWSSPSESAALSHIVAAFNAAGGRLTVQIAPGALAAEQTTIRSMRDGHSPDVAQFNISRQFDQLVEDGQLRRLDSVSSRNNWANVFPTYVQSIIRRNGHFYAVPLGIHNYSAIFFSWTVFRKSGVDSPPGNIDELIADLRKARDHGFVPVAVGPQDWEVKIIFDSLLLGVAGKERFLRLYRDHDVALAASPELTRVLTYLGEIRDLAEPSLQASTWSDATRQVISNHAAVQFMGDWAEGEFIAKGLSAGKDFGCLPGIGTGPEQTAMIGGDVWVFPKTDEPAKIKAQNLLAEVATDPTVQIDFSREKGSIPARLDVDTDRLNVCQQRFAALVRHDDVVPNADMFLSPDESHAIRAVLMRFWRRQLDVAGTQKALQNVL
ncbi:ABC transporter substrate-binding protein [Paraburkholderia kururiensis]|uniref:ABC transporter substrate-binding protein n=1 Tax=Paraburkholderia kururiensis TaxID=984307 RepID=UPI000476AD98|nr:ABC transporter substrate-binding protein [Paraburkholderia kururiensis]